MTGQPNGHDLLDIPDFLDRTKGMTKEQIDKERDARIKKYGNTKFRTRPAEASRPRQIATLTDVDIANIKALKKTGADRVSAVRQVGAKLKSETRKGETMITKITNPPLRAASAAPAAQQEGAAPKKPTPAKKVHPADVTNLAAIADAQHFDVTIFHDRQHIAHREIPTLEEARTKASEMKEALQSHRDALVYAVLKDGRAFPVPRNYTASTTQQETNMAKTATKAKTTTKPAAKSAARKKTATGTGARYDWKGATERAAEGKMPTLPDFSAETHTRYRASLAEVKKLADDKDIAGLKKWKYDGFEGTSVKTVMRYRDLCLTALQAKAA